MIIFFEKSEIKLFQNYFNKNKKEIQKMMKKVFEDKYKTSKIFSFTKSRGKKSRLWPNFICKFNLFGYSISCIIA